MNEKVQRFDWLTFVMIVAVSIYGLAVAYYLRGGIRLRDARDTSQLVAVGFLAACSIRGILRKRRRQRQEGRH